MMKCRQVETATHTTSQSHGKLNSATETLTYPNTSTQRDQWVGKAILMTWLNSGYLHFLRYWFVQVTNSESMITSRTEDEAQAQSDAMERE